jgi:hypothetical protein
MADRVGEDLSNLNLSDMLTYVLSGGWSGDEFCDAAIFVFAFVMQIGGAWTGISFAKIQQIVQSFFNDPDSDWQTLCGCGWYEEIPVGTTYPDNWTLDWGQTAAESVYSQSNGGDGFRSFKLYSSIAARQITEVDFTGRHDENGNTRNIVCEIEASGVVKESLQWTMGSQTTTQSHTFTFTYAGTDIDKITIRGIVNTNPTGDGFIACYEFTPHGEGSNPYP